MARATTAASNGSLHAARAVKNDEFYTQISDIEKELLHYKDHLKGKVVFCNCDDPEQSNFWLHFKLKFEEYGLAKLIATHYAKGETSYKLEFDGGGRPWVRTPLQGDGDFRSEECVEILKSADIVITNPPFSLFREYVAQLVEHNKKFLVIGSQNAITYKEIFKLIRNNQLWLGVKKPTKFGQPDGTVKVFGNIGWFTNLSHNRRNEKLTLYSRYAASEHLYPKYDNYDAIEVSRVNEIPLDFEDAMGVPITFLEKYNPEQFEIVGLANDKRVIDNAFVQGAETYLDEQHKRFVGMVLSENGKLRATYARIVIKKKT